MSALERAVRNTGETTYAAIEKALYDQGVDVSEAGVRKAMKGIGLTPRRRGK